MPYNLAGYKVFIASPGGLEDERRAFAGEIEEYNRIEASQRGVIFQAVGWEETLPGIGRPQNIINEELRQCDYFILLLHDRWGSDPGVSETKASSGTEEEFLIAMECVQKTDQPMKQIVCLFKSVPPNQLADPGPQLQKVIDFQRKIEAEKKLLYSNFSSINELTTLIRKNLSKWLRDDNSQEDGGYVFPKAFPDLPDGIDSRSDMDSTNIIDENGGYIFPKDSPDLPDGIDSKSDMNSTNIIDTDLKKTIDNAWLLAKEGKLVDAEIEFSKA